MNTLNLVLFSLELFLLLCYVVWSHLWTKWELLIPAGGLVFILWAVIPDIPSNCAYDWQAMCGIDAQVRFNVLLPMLIATSLWALARTFLFLRASPQLTYA